MSTKEIATDPPVDASRRDKRPLAPRRLAAASVVTRLPANAPRRIADVYEWAREQGDHIRNGRFDRVDVLNVADEVEDVGRREYEALVSDLTIILLHLLKWDHQVSRRSRSWALSIREHRRRVVRRLQDNPSLDARRKDVIGIAYLDARDRASAETDLALATFPELCPYAWAEILERQVTFDP